MIIWPTCSPRQAGTSHKGPSRGSWSGPLWWGCQTRPRRGGGGECWLCGEWTLFWGVRGKSGGCSTLSGRPVGWGGVRWCLQSSSALHWVHLLQKLQILLYWDRLRAPDGGLGLRRRVHSVPGGQDEPPGRAVPLQDVSCSPQLLQVAHKGAIIQIPGVQC